jgi:hypothetical protein
VTGGRHLAAGALVVLVTATPSLVAPTGGRAATVTVLPDRILNRVDPRTALGGGVDGYEAGEIARIYTPANLRAMRSAGLGSLTYRLRTELAVQAWHWNPRGAWSDPGRRQGYWTSSSRVTGPVWLSYGYRLPRRGNTIDQAADDGYSRLDDGDPRTFWKSNPYLDPHFTREPASRNPQWILLALRRPQLVDALRLDQAAPYARRLRVQWWDGANAVIDPRGNWRPFPVGRFESRGGRRLLRLAPAPVKVRFVRILLEQGSRTAPPGSRDVRDRLGFAVREVGLGRLERGRFRDLVSHVPSHRQTLAYASSTDPWHRASDRDPNTEQPGFDRVLASGLAHGRPILTPVAVLYGTPPDAAAELRWLRARGYPVERIEMGEEPDGQLVGPEDYGALYLQFSRALHRVDSRAQLGGPGFQTSIPSWEVWPDASGNRDWPGRFVAYLRDRRALHRLRFVSFEWYPFDAVCRAPAAQLAHASQLLDSAVAGLRDAGLPRGLPLLISEYGYSAFAARAEVDRAGALLNADVVGRFLGLGGNAAYLYGYEPAPLLHEAAACPAWGNLALFQSDGSRRILHPLATFWETQMLTHDWMQPTGGTHHILDARVDGPGAARLSAYPVRRPDGRLSVLLLNKDPARTLAVALAVADPGGERAPRGALERWQLSAAQYVWRPAGPFGRPSVDRPPGHARLRTTAVSLPPMSLAVVRTEGARW